MRLVRYPLSVMRSHPPSPRRMLIGRNEYPSGPIRCRNRGRSNGATASAWAMNSTAGAGPSSRKNNSTRTPGVASSGSRSSWRKNTVSELGDVVMINAEPSGPSAAVHRVSGSLLKDIHPLVPKRVDSWRACVVATARSSSSSTGIAATTTIDSPLALMNL